MPLHRRRYKRIARSGVSFACPQPHAEDTALLWGEPGGSLLFLLASCLLTSPTAIFCLKFIQDNFQCMIKMGSVVCIWKVLMKLKERFRTYQGHFLPMFSVWMKFGIELPLQILRPVCILTLQAIRCGICNSILQMRVSFRQC